MTIETINTRTNTYESPVRFPMTGIPLDLMLEAIAAERGNTGRLIR